MMDFLRPEFSRIPPATQSAVHGALDFGELERAGLAPENVLDFSVNSNPFGPSPTVRAVLEKTSLDRYPDRECLTLRRALAERLGVSPSQIVVGNGTAELIWLSAFAFLKAGDDALILGPTFGEYERSIRLMSAIPWQWNAPPGDFSFNLPEISRELDAKHYSLVFLCNPNNPTGQVIHPNAILSWADAHPHILFVVDEAYLAFVSGLESVIPLRCTPGTFPDQRSNILVLRSMTKDYALAGLRLGYAVADERLIHALAAVRPAWNVNAFAQAAGLAALNDEPYYQTTLNQLRREKDFLLNGLSHLGYEPVPSQTQFFLFPVDNATQFRQNLLPHGILVRDCTSFGLPNHVRISPRARMENQRLLDAIRMAGE